MERRRKLHALPARAAAAAVTIAAAALVCAPSASASSNIGGCNPQSRGPFTFSACINQPNFYTIDSDGYITSMPRGCFDIRIDIRDKYGDLAKAGTWQNVCHTGRYTGASLGFWDNNNNNPWFSQFTIVDGSSSYVIDSPYID